MADGLDLEEWTAMLRSIRRLSMVALVMFSVIPALLVWQLGWGKALPLLPMQFLALGSVLAGRLILSFASWRPGTLPYYERTGHWSMECDDAD